MVGDIWDAVYFMAVFPRNKIISRPLCFPDSKDGISKMEEYVMNMIVISGNFWVTCGEILFEICLGIANPSFMMISPLKYRLFIDR